MSHQAILKENQQ